MKRILLEHTQDLFSAEEAAEGKEDLVPINEYVSELRLLKDVPFSYLVGDESYLPPESIRFFYLDEGWLDSLTDGAMSVGRVGELDACIDSHCFCLIKEAATRQLTCPRFNRMHKNHRRLKAANPVASDTMTGVILRSELVGKWKGLEAFGFGNEKQLDILRMDSLSSEILICIFSGELTKFVISEPKTGLRFGAADNTGVINLRDVKDTDDFGEPLKGVTVDLKAFTEPNGKLKAADLAKEMQKKLDSTVTSPQFAFELIAVAKRAEFLKGGV